jgi:hypothetical protein
MAGGTHIEHFPARVASSRGIRSGPFLYGPATNKISRLRVAFSLTCVIQIDHTLADVIVVDSRVCKPIGGPWLSVAIDVATRCVLGVHVEQEAPSASCGTRMVGHENARLDSDVSAIPLDRSGQRRTQDNMARARGKCHVESRKVPY